MKLAGHLQSGVFLCAIRRTERETGERGSLEIYISSMTLLLQEEWELRQ
jgi:hypothetical protein